MLITSFDSRWIPLYFLFVEFNGNQNGLVTNVLQNIFIVFHRRNEVIQVWKDMRMSKWWQAVVLWLDCPFKDLHECSSESSHNITAITCNGYSFPCFPRRSMIFRGQFVLILECLDLCERFRQRECVSLCVCVFCKVVFLAWGSRAADSSTPAGCFARSEIA